METLIEEHRAEIERTGHLVFAVWQDVNAPHAGPDGPFRSFGKGCPAGAQGRGSGKSGVERCTWKAKGAGSTNVMRVTDGSGNYRWRIDQYLNMFMTDSGGGDTMVIQNNGAVGILNTLPSYPLDVNGNINATGYYVGATQGKTATINYQKYPSGNGTMTFSNGILIAAT